ncbi:universal stress protein [Anabaena cylindrica UHCC 0172]|uniref:universal stress protein n=1 Tax=Anabaena cylindrica TaxID=1165 RepID=UPI002B20BC50|nr:universal stress protein [Anabaena cylindrica]MEA5554472.1 universal stress protein [Anabaena cylindrica UHCC 0172]
MLARLQCAIGRDDLVEQMVLLPEAENLVSQQYQIANSVNLIVGYDASPQSHTALDIACWIAHQTSLATNTQVTVQAVYVVEQNSSNQYLDIFNSAHNQLQLECAVSNLSKSVTSVLTQQKVREISPKLQGESRTFFKAADRILWQAKTLAQEWQISFKSHLRFGKIGAELKKFVESETADILFLGCKSVDHPMIKTLGTNFPCAVLGIPICIDE